MAATGGRAHTGIEGLPVPESLLSPILDVAATTLSDFEGELPTVLRPLVGFDPRRLGSGPARQQLRRAIDVDEGFREVVVERFLALDEAAAALESWSASLSLRRVEEAAERSDLPLLASVLYAARPEGWLFGLGVVCVCFDRKRADKERADDAKAREMQSAALTEARRRAEDARDDALANVARLETQLRDERKERRERELRADRAVEEANRRDAQSDARVEAANAALEAAEARLARESIRAREAEQTLRDLRREVRARAQTRTEGGGLDASELRVLADAAAEATRLAARLAGLTGTTRRTPPDGSPSPGAGPPDAEPRGAEPRGADPRGADPRGAEPRGGRNRVPCPPGLVATTSAGLDAMLRTRGVQLVVDGYNVSMAGRSEAPIAEQREWLLGSLHRLHLRLRCAILVVFDGADVETAPERRPGVKVIFSSGGEKADPVVVREVAALSPTTPAIVVSSDRWVAEQSEAAGATAVPADALVELLRR